MDTTLRITDIYPHRNKIVSARDKALYSYRQLQQTLKYSPYRELCSVKLNSKKDVINEEINRINDILRAEYERIDEFLEWLESNKDNTLSVRYSSRDTEVMFKLSLITIERDVKDNGMEFITTYCVVDGNHPSNTHGEIDWFWVDYIYQYWQNGQIDVEIGASSNAAPLEAVAAEIHNQPPTENFDRQPEVLYQNTGGSGGQMIAIAQEYNDDNNYSDDNNNDDSDNNDTATHTNGDDGESFYWGIYKVRNNNGGTTSQEVVNTYYGHCISAIKSWSTVALRWLSFILAVLNGEFSWWSRLR